MAELKGKGIIYVLMLIGSFTLLAHFNEEYYMPPYAAFFLLVSLIYWFYKCIVTLVRIMLKDTKDYSRTYSYENNRSYRSRQKKHYRVTDYTNADYTANHEQYMPPSAKEDAEQKVIDALSEQLKLQKDIEILTIEEKTK